MQIMILNMIVAEIIYNISKASKFISFSNFMKMNIRYSPNYIYYISRILKIRSDIKYNI